MSETIDTARLPTVALGDTGLRVSALSLGGNRLGGELDRDASYELLDTFAELGGTFVDTALVYADWLPGAERSCSERTLGRWLHDRGMAGEVVVATKGGHPRLDPGSPPRLDGASLREDVERSLDHLGLDRLPLWYLHRDDPQRPVAEIVDAVQELADEGLLAHYAACNWAPERLAAAVDHARAQGIAGFVAHQVAFSLAQPDLARLAVGLVAMTPQLAAVHRRTGLPVVAYSSQARGYFDRRDRAAALPALAAYDTAENDETGRLLDEVSASAGLTPTQVALAALLRFDVPTIPVVGSRTPDQLRTSVAALAAPVTEHDLAALDARLAQLTR